MGAASSSEPRSVSMDNPNPPGVIDLSDEVVNRLKQGITKQVKENVTAEHSASQKSQPNPPPKPQPKETRAEPVKPAPSPANQPAAPTPSPAPRPQVVFQRPPPVVYAPSAPGATMTALDIRRQKEIELQQNDAMWRERMAQMEQTLKKTNSIMEKEYSAAVEDVRKRFATASPAHQLPPCQDLKAQVIACYRAHPGETLKCAEEVAMFRNCVSVNRVTKLDESFDPKLTDVKAKAA